MTERSHDEAVTELLRQHPTLAAAYIPAALEQVDQPGGTVALLAACWQVTQAQGIPLINSRMTMAGKTTDASRKTPRSMVS